MFVTRFKSKDTSSKIPISPYDDYTFDFETIDCSLEQISRLMTKDFVLCTPLASLGTIRLKRRKSELNDKVSPHLDYLIIDLDNVKSKSSLDETLRYFSQFKSILMESRSYNGVDNFNVKGLLCCDLDVKYAKFALSKIHRDLEEICDLDESMARSVALTAPIHKYQVLLNNLSSDRIFKYEDIDIGYTSNAKQVEVSLPNTINDAKTIPELCLKIFYSMGFTAFSTDSQNEAIRFSHSSEQKTPGGFYWFITSPYRMNHFNPSRSVDIFDDVKNLEVFKRLYRKPIDYANILGSSITSTDTLTVATSRLEVTTEINSIIEQFLDSSSGSICIKSAMGTGKSTLINHCIQQAHDRDQRVLIITNRISVAEDFARKYNLKVYNKDKYRIGDSLICQYDSLHKYSLRYFDVVVMDEFMSLLLHSRSNLSCNAANASRFYSALSRKLIVADAFISQFALKLIKGPIKIIENVWRDPSDVMMYNDANYFWQVLLKTAKKERCTISCTSLNVIHALQLLLTKHNCNVCTLTSTTPQPSKDMIYQHLQDEVPPWDVLIYSPTLTVGVSNLNNVKHHFHYDSSMSNDVVSSAQMTKRTRKADHIHVYVKPRYQVLKTNYDDLKNFYLTHSVPAEDNFMFDLNDYGELKLSRIGRKVISVDQMKNILEVNHKEALDFILKMHFRETRIITDSMYQNILNPYLKDTRENQASIIEDDIRQFKELNSFSGELSPETLAIVNKISTAIDPDCPCKNKIIEVALRRKGFIEACRKLNIFKHWFNTGCKSEYYKVKISNLILYQNEPDMLKFYSALSGLAPMQYQDAYIKKKLSAQQLSILKHLGYKVNNDILGIRTLVVDQEMQEYSQWIS